MTEAASGRDSVFVNEVFSSIQGEGRYVGVRQVFVRLSGCNLRCAYCDEPEALEKKPGRARIEVQAGTREFEVIDSPAPVELVADAVKRLDAATGHKMISLTGGEPLLQPEALRLLLPRLREVARVMIETNATRVDALGVVEPGDVISADIKLTSVDGEEVDPNLQRDFLAAARDRGAEIYCKAVLGASTSPGEVAEAARMISVLDPGIGLYLQPVTPFAAVTATPEPSAVLAAQVAALEYLDDVRVVPQTHKMMGQL